MTRARRMGAAVGLACALAAAAAASAPRGAAGSQDAAAASTRVTAAITGKPTAPISVAYELGSEPALGQPLTIGLTVTSSFALADVVVSSSAGEGLFLVTPQAPQRIARIEARAAHAFEVTVTPLVLDVLYLTIVVEANVGADRQARTVLIPVRLAAAKSRVPATLKTDPANGGIVHSLPGLESPSSRLR